MRRKLLSFAIFYIFSSPVHCASTGDPVNFRKLINARMENDAIKRLVPLYEPEPPLNLQSQNRTKRFFGITSGAYGSNLQLGLSFIVPFLNIPLGGGLTGTPYYNGDANQYYGATAPYGGAYGQAPQSLLGNGAILPIILAIGAVILIPYLINSFTGLQTSPYGRSDDMQEMLNNLWARVESALQEQNIDINSCLQKTICQHSQHDSKRSLKSDATEETILQKILNFVIRSLSVNALMEGTRIEEALSAGQQSESGCLIYSKRCPYSWDSVFNGLVSFALETYNTEMSAENFTDA